ncbi:hypothetical protein ScPMuIL_000599 [Solemya velum]
MAATCRMNRELQKKAMEQEKHAKDPVELLRCKCLARGACGIKGLACSFKIMDDDGNRTLDLAEFKKGVQTYGLVVDEATLREMFQCFDRNGNGKVDYEEFIVNLRPPMSNARKSLITQAFVKLDKTGDGVITVEDLRGVYNVKKHPKYLNGEWTEDQCLLQFLNAFDSQEKDGKITRDEFDNYYCGVSASIDNDAYFDLMMRAAWKL